MEDAAKENNGTKKDRVNKRKLGKKLQSAGQEYISPDTNKIVSARKIKGRCDAEECKMMSRHCRG